MAVRIQVPKRAALVRFVLHPWGKALLIAFLVVNTLALGTFVYYYAHYSRIIEQKLAAGPFANTSMLFASPKIVMVGDEITPAEIIAQLRRSAYGETRGNRMGWYNLRNDAVEIYPGVDSFFLQEDGVIMFSGNKVSKIISLQDNTERTQYRLEPELITNLFDRNREKRRLVRFPEIPKVLINAVISAEDKRFFQHSGFDPIRIIRSAYVDVKEQRNAQGASTLTMQLARQFWLTADRTWKRKFPEVMITLHLEQKLSKEQIFEYYANQIDLGRRGSFAIRGFGEAAQAYFGKDIRQLTLAEAATLAGLNTADLKAMAPARTLLTSAANTMAVFCFIVVGAVRWPELAAMLIAVVVGGYAGARGARFLPPRLIRGAVVVLCAAVTVYFFRR